MSFMTSTCDALMFSNAISFPTPSSTHTRANASESPNRGEFENESSPFGELVSLVKEHDELIADLASLRVRLNRASNYLKSEGSRFTLGKAYFDRLKQKHSTILCQLSDNRLRARRFLQKLDHETAGV